MSLYNDGYSNRALVLAAAGAAVADGGLSFGRTTFTQTSTNNLVATDTIQIGNGTYTFVSAIGTTPGNVLRGASWLASMQNLVAAILASQIGGASTANYIPLAAAANMNASVAGGVATFTPIAPGTTFPSVYTASGTSAGSFPAATFGASASAPASRAVNWNIGLGLSIQFETTATIVNPAVFQVWSDVPSNSNNCVASGVSGNQQQMADDDLCNPLTGGSIPMTITIPATATVTAFNTQGFAETQIISAVGGVVQGRPRCLGPGKFVFVKGISGDINNVNVTALISRLKLTS